MLTVTVQDKYVEALRAFGDVQKSIDVALQRYTVEQIASKITDLRQRDREYQNKYGVDYATFVQRIAQDEAFVQNVENNINPLWERDLADWEFCTKGIEDWTHILQTILLE